MTELEWGNQESRGKGGAEGKVGAQHLKVQPEHVMAAVCLEIKKRREGKQRPQKPFCLSLCLLASVNLEIVFCREAILDS